MKIAKIAVVVCVVFYVGAANGQAKGRQLINNGYLSFGKRSLDRMDDSSEVNKLADKNENMLQKRSKDTLESASVKSIQAEPGIVKRYLDNDDDNDDIQYGRYRSNGHRRSSRNRSRYSYRNKASYRHRRPSSGYKYKGYQKGRYGNSNKYNGRFSRYRYGRKYGNTGRSARRLGGLNPHSDGNGNRV